MTAHNARSVTVVDAVVHRPAGQYLDEPQAVVVEDGLITFVGDPGEARRRTAPHPGTSRPAAGAVAPRVPAGRGGPRRRPVRLRGDDDPVVEFLPAREPVDPAHLGRVARVPHDDPGLPFGMENSSMGLPSPGASPS